MTAQGTVWAEDPTFARTRETHSRSLSARRKNKMSDGPRPVSPATRVAKSDRDKSKDISV